MPSVSSPIQAAYSFIASACRNNSAIMTLLDNDNSRVGQTPFPSTVKFPAIGFTVNATSDITVIGNEIVHAYVDVAVYGISRSDTIASVNQLSTLIHNVIHDEFNAETDTPYGKILSCTRLFPVHFTEVDKENKIWQYLGGTYRLFIQ